MESAKSNTNNGYQNVIVMRHGDRIDKVDPLWVSTAARPWDSPLNHDGIVRAFGTGQRIRSQNRFPIHRIFVSPLLRCIQTASEIVAALSAVDFDPNAKSSKDVSSIHKSKLKVSIEFGLCEIKNTKAIRCELPKDKKFDFKISDLEAMFPEGTVDPNVDMVYKEMPQWDETLEDSRNRYMNTLKALAEKYPTENLLLVTHWGGVNATMCTFLKTQTKYIINYCDCVELGREVSSKDEFLGFEFVTSHGISFKEHNKKPNP